MNTNEKFSADIPFDQRGIIKGQLGFSTIFYFQDIVDYETKNDQWKKDILDASIQEGVMKSNIFGWQSDYECCVAIYLTQSSRCYASR